MGWFGPAGDCGCCAACTCNGAPLGKLYVTVSGVTMNASPTLDECLGDRFGETIDETWYNGVTFVFDLEWEQAEFQANNPNEYDAPGFASQCLLQGGYWICTQELEVPPNPETFFLWGIKVQLSIFGGKQLVVVSLDCAFDLRFSGQSHGQAIQDNIAATQVSNVDIWMLYDTACPVGTPTEIFRDNVGDSGAFDFTGATVSLVWA